LPRQGHRSDAASVTIRQVAARAGVSVTTVSHALSGRGRVDPNTKTRVLAAAKALGYRPNRSAQNLRLGRARTLALLLPAAADRGTGDTNLLLAADFYVTVANVAARAAFSQDHALMLLPPWEPRLSVDAPPVDGAVVVDPVRADPRLRALDEAGIPTVTIERDPSRLDDPWWVAPDNRGNTVIALNHLADAGATRIALLSVDVDAGWAIENEEAFTAWCSEHDKPPIVARASLENLVESTEQAVRQLVDAPARPDAIFAIAELFGPPALTAVQAIGLDVPGDMLMASGHDSRAAQLSRPPLTAIDARPDAQANAAIELLLARLAGEPPAHHAIPGQLRVRRSSQRFS
jgi:DNA-binding LacI/PurR family transcriptional regulator